MAVKNSTIMYKLYQTGSTDYARRVPDPTQATMKQTVDAIFAPNNGLIYNEFVDTLVNRIGDTIVHQREWENPLAVFKSSKMNYGTTVQEIATKWVQAHSYDDAAEILLKMNRPEAEVCYHAMNRQDRYDITVNRDELRQAFIEEYGLNNFINSILTVPINSDNYDEYRSMLELLAMYEEKWGFFKHQLSAAPTDEDTSKEFLQSIRTYAGKLKFPSTLYNAGIITDIPVFADMSELVLMITPEALAAIDVQALAAAFNRTDAEIQMRTVIIDEFPIPNAVALLTTENFFVCRDTEYTTASFFNGSTLSTNYYLHHWEILSVSPFVPAILFTTDTGTGIGTVTQTVTGLSLSASAATIKPGSKDVKLTATITGTSSEADIPVVPDAATYTITAAKSDDTPINLNSRTYVDRFGYLHLQKSNLSDGDIITVTATSTYVNPSGETPTGLTDTVTITVDVD